MEYKINTITKTITVTSTLKINEIEEIVESLRYVFLPEVLDT